MGTGVRWFLSLLLVIAVAAGGWTAYQRYALERSNRQFELAVDSRLLFREDFGGGKIPADGLQELKEAGCTAVAVNPLTLMELETLGEVTLLDTAGLQRLQALGLLGNEKERGPEMLPQGIYILPTGNNIYEEIRLALYPLLGDQIVPRLNFEATGFSETRLLFIPMRHALTLKELPLFLPREQMLYWSREGLQVIPLFHAPSRLPPDFNEKYWEILAIQLMEAENHGNINMKAVAFPSGNFTYPLPNSRAGEMIRDGGFALGAVEFIPGKGLKDLAPHLDYRVIRTHQITVAEMGQLGELRSRERFVRAVQERKVRLLLLQPFPELDPRGEFTAYLGFIKNLNSDLVASGYFPGEASPFPIFLVPAAVQSLQIAGAAAAAALLAGLFILKNKKPSLKRKKIKRTYEIIPKAQRRNARLDVQKEKIFFGFSICLVLGALALPLFYLLLEPVLPAAGASVLSRLPSYEFLQKGAALLASFVFPTLGTILFLGPSLQKSAENGYLKEIIKGFLAAALFSTGGAIIASGILGDTRYFLNIEAFAGVKLSQFVPFILLGLYILLQKRQGLKREMSGLLDMQVKVKHLIVISLVVGGLLVYLMRGGNFPALPVSELEMALRRYLEIIFVARPRFKEFLIGYPGFFLMSALVPAGIKGVKTMALFLGLLGQISLFNTFMHLHRPVGLSLLGTVYGIIVGLILGMLLYLIIAKVAATRKIANS
ncbi:MAG: DUF5693 family protein [Bacillota bacterium]|nr:DUF5693 family protein [Bacillota bacterium]